MTHPAGWLAASLTSLDAGSKLLPLPAGILKNASSYGQVSSVGQNHPQLKITGLDKRLRWIMTFAFDTSVPTTFPALYPTPFFFYSSIQQKFIE